MTTLSSEELEKLAETFASWECPEDHEAVRIARSIPTEQLAEFLRKASARLDALAKEWARQQKDVPHWIGAAHPRAPYELKRKRELLETEWRIRNG
jgi:hypothetical protein